MKLRFRKYVGRKMPIFDLANSIAQAIQTQEGYGTANAVTITANNNPGALRSWPGFPTVNGYTQFPSYERGYQALLTDVTTNINKPNWTLADFITRYEGGSANVDRNDIPKYINFVSSQTGIPADVPLSSLIDSSGVVQASDNSATSASDTLSAITDTLSNIDPGTLGVIAIAGVVGLLVFSRA